jgi:hypothetical protein
MVILLEVLLRNFLFTADLDDDFSAARAVEFTEEDALPGAELQSPALNKNLFAAADKRAFAMRIGIAFGMPVARTALGQQFLKRQEQVVRNGWIGVFVDGNRRGSVGTIDNNIAVSDAAPADKRTDLAGNINHLIAALCVDAKIFLDNVHDTHIPNLS